MVERKIRKRVKKTSPKRTRKTSPKRTRKTSPRRTKQTSPKRKVQSKKLNAGFFKRLSDNIRGRFSPTRQRGGLNYRNDQELDIKIEEEKRASIISALSDRYEIFFKCHKKLYDLFIKSNSKGTKLSLLNKWRRIMVRKIAIEQGEGDNIPSFSVLETYAIKQDALDLCTKVIKEKYDL